MLRSQLTDSLQPTCAVPDCLFKSDGLDEADKRADFLLGFFTPSCLVTPPLQIPIFRFPWNLLWFTRMGLKRALERAISVNENEFFKRLEEHLANSTSVNIEKFYNRVCTCLQNISSYIWLISGYEIYKQANIRQEAISMTCHWNTDKLCVHDFNSRFNIKYAIN